MKVYMLISQEGEYDDYRSDILGIFSSKEEAKASINVDWSKRNDAFLHHTYYENQEGYGLYKQVESKDYDPYRGPRISIEEWELDSFDSIGYGITIVP